MTEVQESILDKIQKLLSLANSPNKHESELAMMKAMELMTKYNVSIEQIQEEGFKGYKDETITDHFIHFELTYLRDILEKYFYVRTLGIQGRDKLHIVGKASNVSVAVYLLHFLHNKFNQEYVEFKKQMNGAKVFRKAYYEGLWRGLCEKLKAETQRLSFEEGLIVVKDKKMDEFFDSLFNPNSLRKTSLAKSTPDNNSLRAGYETGKNIQLNPGINSSNTNKTLRLGN